MPIPVLVEVDELPDAQRPQSADPDFWNVWTLAEERGAIGAQSQRNGRAPLQRKSRRRNNPYSAGC